MKINKNLKKYTLIFFIILALTVGYLFRTYFLSDNFFSQNTGLYLFSGLMQSNAAIFAILGVFYIFKLQTLHSSTDIILNSFVLERSQWTNPNWIFEFYNKSLAQKIEMYKKLNYSRQIMDRLDNWIQTEQSIESVTRNLKFPLIIVAIGIILNLVGLIFSNYIHHLGVNFEFNIYYFNIIFEVLIIYCIVNSILKIISTS